MKRVHEFIAKANQVLLFLALIAATGAIGFGIYDSFGRSPTEPHVVVAPPNSAPAVTEVRDVRFLGTSDDNFVFGIVKRTVSGDVPDKNLPVLELYSAKRAQDHPGEIVNVIFSRGDKVVKTLLQNDGLVLRHRLPTTYEHEEFVSCIFVYAAEDTNGDAVLDSRDRQDLVIVAPDLQLPDIIVKHCVDFDVTSPTTLMAKTRADGSLRFVHIDVTTGAKTEINWK